MNNVEELCVALRSAKTADDYAREAESMINDGDKHGLSSPGVLAGPLHLLRCVSVDLNIEDVLLGVDTAEDLEKIAKCSIKAAHVLLHNAHEATNRAVLYRMAQIAKRGDRAERTAGKHNTVPPRRTEKR